MVTHDSLEARITVQNRRTAGSERHGATDFPVCGAEVEVAVHQNMPTERHMCVCIIGGQCHGPLGRFASHGIQITDGPRVGGEVGHSTQCTNSMRIGGSEVRIE